MAEPAKILVFDSGLGGLTVEAQIRRQRPDADIVYAADDAGFPYGPRDETWVIERVGAVMAELIAAHAPDIICIACNTASTIVLAPLRARFPQVPFVGTVPAIKPAAHASRSKIIAVLATPGTVQRDYTRDLTEQYARDCEVVLVGAPRLANLAEAHMRGEAVADADIAAETAPCFVAGPQGRVDTIALACTHYPLLLKTFERLAPWPVNWIDPAPAIARRVDQVLREQLDLPSRPRLERPATMTMRFTSGRAPSAELLAFLQQRDPAAAQN
ncbi:glutamate racemase [Methylovirgula sp. 4M-Z18]|uniref:glutamate racemase n=1 Tax=Methylovirgula sp. 4M-Z18 TaxID=2293567 RepID=UPI000E2E69E5|nr:glutamate racemase [Methylovirgula sp. 4M-Z18]RFB79078.1 glutamate racemase [Methylovirgula sp. 4M-Z18]